MASESGESQYRRFLASCCFVALAAFGAWGWADVILGALGAPVAAASDFEYIEGLGLAPKRNVQNIYTSTDANGFRRAFTPQRTRGEFRILVLGDSVALGTGVRLGEEWPAQLELNLRAAGYPVTVLNAAVAGRTGAYMRRAARYFGMRLKPDLIVVQDTGNILALIGNDREAISHLQQGDVELVVSNVRRWHSALGSARAARCFDDASPAYETLEMATAPRAFQYAATHSPLAFKIVGFLSALHRIVDPRAAPASRSRLESCPGYLTTELVYLIQLAGEARSLGIPVAVVKPAYTFTWRLSQGLALDLSPQYQPPHVFADDPAGLERFLRGLDALHSRAFEGSSVVLLDPVRTHLRHAPPPGDIHQIYLGDYTHYSPHGAPVFASAIATELAERGLLPRPTAQRPWIHPDEERTADSADLRYRPLRPDIRTAQIAVVVFVVVIVLAAIGAICLALTGWNSDGDLLLTPALGGFVLLSCQLLGLNVVGWLQANGAFASIGAVVAVVALAAFLGRSHARPAHAARALLALCIASFAMAIALSAICRWAAVPGSVTAKALQTLVAWVDLSSPGRERVATSALYMWSLNDHVERPIGLPATVRSDATSVELSNPRIATLLSSRVPAASAIIGMLGATYLSGMFAVIFCLRGFARGRARRATHVAAATCLYLALVFWKLPSIVALYHALGILVIGLGVATATARPFVASVLVVLGGVSLYFLPPALFFSATFALTITTLAVLRRSEPTLRRAIVGTLAVVVLAASSRMLVLDRSVGNAELLRAHDADHLGFATYVYR